MGIRRRVSHVQRPPQARLRSNGFRKNRSCLVAKGLLIAVDNGHCHKGSILHLAHGRGGAGFTWMCNGLTVEVASLATRRSRPCSSLTTDNAFQTLNKVQTRLASAIMSPCEISSSPRGPLSVREVSIASTASARRKGLGVIASV